jgi:hypothetical protein
MKEKNKDLQIIKIDGAIYVPREMFDAGFEAVEILDARIKELEGDVKYWKGLFDEYYEDTYGKVKL